MKNFMFSKRFAAIVLASIMAITTAMPVCAAEKSSVDTSSSTYKIDVKVDSNTMLGSRRRLLTSSASEIDGGSGNFECVLPDDTWDGYIMAGVASSNVDGLVSCFVHTPDGHDYALGDVAASGGQTPLIHFTFCGEGTYTFYFTVSCSDLLDVYGRIYSSN